jgi:hypothetical protein
MGFKNMHIPIPGGFVGFPIEDPLKTPETPLKPQESFEI